MGLESSKEQLRKVKSYPQPQMKKILVCEREVQNVSYTIVSETYPKMNEKELDYIAQNIHGELQNIIHLTSHRIRKEISIGKRSILCFVDAINEGNGTNWIIKAYECPCQLVGVS